MKEKIAKWYKQGLWNKEMVIKAAEKGVISEKEIKTIIQG